MFKRVLLVSLVGLLATLSALALFVSLRRSGRGAASEADVPQTTAAIGRAGDHSEVVPRAHVGRELLFNAEMDAEAVKLFREYAKYPPDSRPLRGDELDVIEPFSFPPSPILLGAASCALQPTRHSVAEGETVSVRLFCHYPHDPTHLVPVVIHDASVTLPATKATESKDALSAAAIAFNDAGRDGDERAGDHVYTWAFSPGEGHFGDVTVSVRLAPSVPDLHLAAPPSGASPAPYELRASFFSSPSAPAYFTGRTQDGLLDGSMVVDVELDVRRAGRFHVAANLYQGDSPVGYATADEKLSPGRCTVRLRFFGKIFRDQQRQGAFELVHLRGSRSNLPFDPLDLASLPPSEVSRILTSVVSTGPERELVPSWTGRIRTQVYPISAFSPEEWQSPAKERRLAELEDSAVDGDFGRP